MLIQIVWMLIMIVVSVCGTGKAYYYHVITRKTQWERPTDKDAEGTIIMDLGTPEPDSDKEQDEVNYRFISPFTPNEPLYMTCTCTCMLIDMF